MTDSPSEPTGEETDGGAAADAAGATPEDGLSRLAAELNDAVGGSGWTAEFDTIRIAVARDRWVDTIGAARRRLPYFSWLSAVDWAREVSVGEPAADPEALDERYEVLCCLGAVGSEFAIFVTEVPKDDAWLDSLVPVFGGAEWHERETAEMFGIDFRGHPNLSKLYLPDAFEGHPLRKSYPLLSREVKPWPGTVDVEGMPGDGGDGEEAP